MTQRLHLLLFMLTSTAAFVIVGCGRPSLPGRQFQGETRTVPGGTEMDGAVPENPILEWGPEDAPVQVVAFYPIDEAHQKLMDILKELATEDYPGKVRVRYVDYRTREGMKAFLDAELQVPTILINGKSSVELQGERGVRTVDLVKDMGRYWTEKDLRQAIGEAVKHGTNSP